MTSPLTKNVIALRDHLYQ